MSNELFRQRAHLGKASGGVVGEPVKGIGPMADAMERSLREAAARTLHPDECLLGRKSSRDARCLRADHPTPTSDCTTRDWLRHESEK